MTAPTGPKGWLTRLRVFRAVKAHMEAHGESPAPERVALALSLADHTVRDHMRALRRADGLPFPIPDGRLAEALQQGLQDSGSLGGRMAAAYRSGTLHGNGEPLPVDTALRISRSLGGGG